MQGRGAVRVRPWKPPQVSRRVFRTSNLKQFKEHDFEQAA
jgi:hypothetical protein